MENEKEQIAKRLDRVKKKVERLNNTSSMLDLSRLYRTETDREQKIIQQKADLHTTNVQLEQKTDRLERTLKDLQTAFHDLNAESEDEKMSS
jgi:intraflagellar transport protein 81